MLCAQEMAPLQPFFPTLFNLIQCFFVNFLFIIQIFNHSRLRGGRGRLVTEAIHRFALSTKRFFSPLIRFLRIFSYYNLYLCPSLHKRRSKSFRNCILANKIYRTLPILKAFFPATFYRLKINKRFLSHLQVCHSGNFWIAPRTIQACNYFCSRDTSAVKIIWINLDASTRKNCLRSRHETLPNLRWKANYQRELNC